MQLLDQDVVKVRKWAESHVEIKEVWLFGSRARGDARPHSDIDLAIVLQGSSASKRQVTWSFSVAEWRQELKLEHAVHLELLEREFDIYVEVKRDGIRIYPTGESRCTE